MMTEMGESKQVGEKVVAPRHWIARVMRLTSWWWPHIDQSPLIDNQHQTQSKQKTMQGRTQTGEVHN